MNPPQDLTGQRFGRLRVSGLAEERNAQGRRQWWCRCDCGAHVIVLACLLTGGETRSCGCLKKRQGGGWGTPEYRSWRNLIARCYNRRNTRYASYGGRGIRVCDRWRDSFSNFREDMGQCPPGCSIDRIDNNGNYEASNCRWATRIQQARNKTTTRIIECNGKTLSMAEWAELTGIGFRIIHQRLKSGWTVEDALSRPKKKFTPR
jgi:hypothetical protein